MEYPRTSGMMEPREEWIWLPAAAYPERQETILTKNGNKDNAVGNYTVARFSRVYDFGRPVAAVALRFSADTAFRLTCCGKYTARGPAAVGGDFLFNELPRPQHYATVMTLTAADYPDFGRGRIEFSAVVRMRPTRLFEFSQGRGGFFLDGVVFFSDGDRLPIGTGDGWSAQLLGAYREPGRYDGSVPDDAPVPAAPVANVWHALTSPLPPCTEEEIVPQGAEFSVPAGEEKDFLLPMDMIRAGYLAVRCDAKRLHLHVRCSEVGEGGSEEDLLVCGKTEFIGLDLHSAGVLRVTAKNEADTDAAARVTFLASAYPVEAEAVTETSDEELNLVLRVCAHTLRYCRQTIHLDSPRHCEPLACTGDYYIEALMTAFTFGDMRLAAFDVRRTAQLLRYHDGRMFHTTYSLIWVLMLWDVYMLTGERELLTDCEDALRILLRRFDSYLGENGLVETPPDYMFIDWLNPDGISTHHPPKALGQTCLCLFRYGALRTAEKIFAELGDGYGAARAKADADAAGRAITAHLWDPERGLFFEGLNTPTPPELVGGWMPQNVEKRYYRRHANILAAYFGVLPPDECRSLLRRVLADDSLGEVQPYFMHFELEAIYRCGLRDEATLKLLDLWKAPVRLCAKGLAEAFYPPELMNGFDHSHAWGGTPAWALPRALTGLEILEPGMRRLAFSPSLLGLASADAALPTPHGTVTLRLRQGEAPRVECPPDVTVELRP